MNALLQDPDFMRTAMEQVSKMSPEQMADMQRKMANLPPGFFQQQMANLPNMSPADVQRAREEMARTSPGAAQQAFSQVADRGADAGASSGSGGPLSGKVQEAQQLKDAGNALHKQQAFAPAAQKYAQAKALLVGERSDAAAALRKACSLNMAACQLQTRDWAACDAECSEVLAAFPRDRKALYRRGQARLKLRDAVGAAQDLEAALDECALQP